MIIYLFCSSSYIDVDSIVWLSIREWGKFHPHILLAIEVLGATCTVGLVRRQWVGGMECGKLPFGKEVVVLSIMVWWYLIFKGLINMYKYILFTHFGSF